MLSGLSICTYRKQCVCVWGGGGRWGLSVAAAWQVREKFNLVGGENEIAGSGCLDVLADDEWLFVNQDFENPMIETFF